MIERHGKTLHDLYMLEKIAYVVVISFRKLHHYFKAHKVLVTNQPLLDLFHNREASGRISKWA